MYELGAHARLDGIDRFAMAKFAPRAKRMGLE